MKTRLIGDIHGDFYGLRASALHDWEGPFIQLGDFGVGFGQSDYWHESVDAYMCAANGRFIRGNHDNPATARNMRSCINDGNIEDDVMFIGGAWSIDNPVAPPGWYRRTAGVDWWFDEECSDERFEQMFEAYTFWRPRVMITHDCPASISYKMFWNSGLLKGPTYPNRTSAWFDRFLEAHEPEAWYFGHWHHTTAYKHNRTHFQCIGILDYVDVDL